MDVFLSRGAHKERASGMCAMEFAAYLAGLEHTDRPACVSPVLLALMIGLNDQMDDETRQRLRTFIVRTLGTADDSQDERRTYMVADWAVRECAPMALEASGLNKRAQTLRELPAVEDQVTARAAAAAADAACADAASAAASAAAYAAAAHVWESALSMLGRVIDPGGIHALRSEAECLQALAVVGKE